MILSVHVVNSSAHGRFIFFLFALGGVKCLDVGTLSCARVSRCVCLLCYCQLVSVVFGRRQICCACVWEIVYYTLFYYWCVDVYWVCVIGCILVFCFVKVSFWHVECTMCCVWECTIVCNAMYWCICFEMYVLHRCLFVTCGNCCGKCSFYIF